MIDLKNHVKMTSRELLERIAALTAENTALKANGKVRERYLKVSEKGAVSLYGLRRFPFTCYKDEWAVIFSEKEAIEAFIAEHAGELSVKGEKAE